MAPTVPAGTQQADLGTLLAGAVHAVVEAQDVLDAHAREQAAAFVAEPPGSLALPPLWFAFDGVSIEVEMSSEVVRREDTVRLMCRTLNPVTAGLFGYSASTGTRVSVSLSPQRYLPPTA